MTLVETLTLFHVLAAIVWVGGAFMLLIAGERAYRARDDVKLTAFVDNFAWVGLRVFMPASLVLIVAAVWLTYESRPGFDFDQAWISIGFLVWLVGFVLGAAYYGPESGRIKKAVAADGPTATEVLGRLSRVRMIAWVEFVLFLIVVWAMVSKPGL